ncbi:hypothetical protein D6833_09295 [Candidatus Parcubacteria bacterium]|nr:MAG: hypothetical protein D6833_09295 [Candidatus Parcubacteria bacterium]
MKRRLALELVMVGLVAFSAAAWPQEKEVTPQKKVQLAQVMQDSVLVEQVMEQVAGNEKLRLKMMRKMMDAVKSNDSDMMAMCKAMLGDEEMHRMMMKTMRQNMRSTRHRSAAREVLVKFKPDAKEAQIESLASEIGMQQVKVIKELRLRVFRITSDKSVKEVIEACQKEPFVEYAEPNQRYKTQKR